MAVVEKTIDIIGDEAFSNLIVSKTIPEGVPVDFYDDVVASFGSSVPWVGKNPHISLINN